MRSRGVGGQPAGRTVPVALVVGEQPDPPDVPGLAASYAGGRVLVVAHSTVVRLVLCALLGIDPARYREVMPELGNCTLNEVALDPGRRDGGAALLSYNAAPRATAVVR